MSTDLACTPLPTENSTSVAPNLPAVSCSAISSPCHMMGDDVKPGSLMISSNTTTSTGHSISALTLPPHADAAVMSSTSCSSSSAFTNTGCSTFTPLPQATSWPSNVTSPVFPDRTQSGYTSTYQPSRNNLAQPVVSASMPSVINQSNINNTLFSALKPRTPRELLEFEKQCKACSSLASERSHPSSNSPSSSQYLQESQSHSQEAPWQESVGFSDNFCSTCYRETRNHPDPLPLRSAGQNSESRPGSLFSHTTLPSEAHSLPSSLLPSRAPAGNTASLLSPPPNITSPEAEASPYDSVTILSPSLPPSSSLLETPNMAGLNASSVASTSREVEERLPLLVHGDLYKLPSSCLPFSASSGPVGNEMPPVAGMPIAQFPDTAAVHPGPGIAALPSTASAAQLGSSLTSAAFSLLEPRW